MITIKLAVLVLILLVHSDAWGITIATGSPEGTYFKIAQDIKKIAEKEGIPIEIVSTNGSFDNINLLGSGKVDLAIVQMDVLKFAAEVMQAQAGFNVFEQAKVVLNLYPEEIHIITRDESIRSLYQLEGKRVAIGPERSGSALTAEVLLASHDLNVQKSFDAPNDALEKLRSGALDALIFVGGAPVPAFEKLDKSFRLVRLPANSIVEQIYFKAKMDQTTYAWATATDSYAVPSVIMTRDRRDNDYAATIQKLVLAILINKDHLDKSGHPKWKSAQLRPVPGNVAFRPSNDVIQLYTVLDNQGYRIIKK